PRLMKLRCSQRIALLSFALLFILLACGVGVSRAQSTSPVRINEVESNGGTPGDWVELYNPSGAPADNSGFILKDNDDPHIFTIPAATTLGPGAYQAFDVESSFGLGSADSARLFDTTAALVDSYSWTAHAITTYGRCQNGTGPFMTMVSSTKGAA